MGSVNSINSTELGESILDYCFETRVDTAIYWHSSNGGLYLTEWSDGNGNLEADGFQLRLPAGVRFQVVDVSMRWSFGNGTYLDTEIRFLDDIDFKQVDRAVFADQQRSHKDRLCDNVHDIRRECRSNSRLARLTDGSARQEPRLWALRGTRAYVSTSFLTNIHFRAERNLDKALEFDTANLLKRAREPLDRIDKLRYRRLHVWNQTWLVCFLMALLIVWLVAVLWRRKQRRAAQRI